MSKLDYGFLGYVVRAEKCDIRIERQFDDEYDALKFAEQKASFGFSVRLEKVLRAKGFNKKCDNEVCLTGFNPMEEKVGLLKVSDFLLASSCEYYCVHVGEEEKLMTRGLFFALYDEWFIEDFYFGFESSKPILVVHIFERD